MLIGLLPLLTDDESAKLHDDFQGKVVCFPGVAWSDAPLTVSDLFEAQVQTNGSNTALCDDDESLTYNELGARSDALCDIILSELAGGTPEAVIGLRVDRTVRLVVGQLACFKAAAAYLPIDPALPAERVKYMLELASSALLLTDARLMDDGEINAAVTSLGMKRLCIADPRVTDGTTSRVPRPPTTPSSLANVIFTSGSSGKPKGVMVEHHTIVNLIRWYISKYAMTAEANASQVPFSSRHTISTHTARVCACLSWLSATMLLVLPHTWRRANPSWRPIQRASQVLGVGFDPVFLEMWPALCCGASVHVVSAETKANPDALAKWLVDNKISNSILP